MSIIPLRLHKSWSLCSPGYEVRTVNYLFRSDDCIRLVSSVVVILVLFPQVDSQGVDLVPYVFLPSCNMIINIFVYIVQISFLLDLL
jgi:hypothetical protein